MAVAALPVQEPEDPEQLPVTFPVTLPVNGPEKALAVTVPLVQMFQARPMAAPGVPLLQNTIWCPPAMVPPVVLLVCL